jgi:hypothetical protein
MRADGPLYTGTGTYAQRTCITDAQASSVEWDRRRKGTSRAVAVATRDAATAYTWQHKGPGWGGGSRVVTLVR